MNERDDPNLSSEEHISDEVSERVRSVLAAAESAATAIRHEAEQQSQLKMRAAEAERQRFIENAKAEAEALLEERMKRIAELSDSIIEGAEAVLLQLDGAREAKQQLESMVASLAQTAQRLADESAGLRDPAPPRPIDIGDEPGGRRMHAVPEPEPASVTELRSTTVEPEPESEPDVTEAATASDEGPARPRDLKPVDVAPDDDGEVEVVDAVEVVEVEGEEPDIEPEEADVEPEPQPSRGRRSPVERFRRSRESNGATEKARKEESRSFEGDDMLAARLVALQMAVAGSARDEVQDHLRKTFDLEDPAAILNDVFGAESKL